jgi:protein gp37
VRGCSIVSKGCTNCYAMKMAHRSSGAGGAYEGLTKLTKGGPVWTGEVRELEELLDQPLKWKRPRRIFVNSMSDLFHEKVHGDFIDHLLDVVKRCEHLKLGHTFQVLTKRPDADDEVHAALRRCRTSGSASASRTRPRPTSGSRSSCRRRRPCAGSRPSRCSGRRRRELALGRDPRIPAWARALRDQCADAGVAFFFKQWGAWSPFTYISANDGHKLVRIGHSKHDERREIAIGGPADGTEPFQHAAVYQKSKRP